MTEVAGDCQPWNGALLSDGYGHRWDAATGRTRLAHVVAYEVKHGPVPAGLELDHLCRNRACCNPDHLEPVTHRENVLRGTSFAAVNAAKTSCPRGHPYDDENTRTDQHGRHCRPCARIHSADYRARKATL